MNIKKHTAYTPLNSNFDAYYVHEVYTKKINTNSIHVVVYETIPTGCKLETSLKEFETLVGGIYDGTTI